MNGIHAALEGMIIEEPRLGRLPSGDPIVNLIVRVTNGKVMGKCQPFQMVELAVAGYALDTMPQLEKDDQIYADGAMWLARWQDRAGEAQSTLKLTAWRLYRIDAIGRDEIARGLRAQDKKEAANAAAVN